MHDEKTVQRFIDLRVQGWVFTRIAAELNVTKTTLIAWSRQHQHTIANLTAIERENRLHEHLASGEARVQKLGAQLRAAEVELARRDLTTLSTGRLLTHVEYTSNAACRKKPARCGSSAPWTRFPRMNMPTASKSGTRKATRPNWRVGDRPRSRLVPRSRPRPNPFTELASGLETLIRFHQSHPGWFPPASGGARRPLRAVTLDPEWEEAFRKAYPRGLGGAGNPLVVSGDAPEAFPSSAPSVTT